MRGTNHQQTPYIGVFLLAITTTLLHLPGNHSAAGILTVMSTTCYCVYSDGTSFKSEGVAFHLYSIPDNNISEAPAGYDATEPLITYHLTTPHESYPP